MIRLAADSLHRWLLPGVVGFVVTNGALRCLTPVRMHRDGAEAVTVLAFWRRGRFPFEVNRFAFEQLAEPTRGFGDFAGATGLPSSGTQVAEVGKTSAGSIRAVDHSPAIGPMPNPDCAR